VTIICANEKQMPRRDPLRPYMEVIAAFAEAESPVKPSAVRKCTCVPQSCGCGVCVRELCRYVLYARA
jgi:hypothetical protein